MPARGYDLNRDAFYNYLKEGLKKFKSLNGPKV